MPLWSPLGQIWADSLPGKLPHRGGVRLESNSGVNSQTTNLIAIHEPSEPPALRQRRPLPFQYIYPACESCFVSQKAAEIAM